MADKAEVEEEEVVEEVSLRDSIETALESDEEEVVEEPEPTETPAEPAAEPETPAEPIEEPEVTDAPAHWALEDQETFRALDPKAQQFLLGRSKDMEAAHTKRSQEIAPLRNVTQKWQPYLDKIGATPEQAVEALFAAEYTLRTGTEAQKREALIKLASDYGIPIGEPAAEAPADFMTDGINKAVQPLQETVRELQARLASQDQASQQSQLGQLAEQIRQFQEAKTEAGQPAHPYFDEVRDEMARLAQADKLAGRPSDLADLYDRAIHADPTVRAKLQSAQQHAAKLQSEREQKEKVKKAKRASVSVTGVSSAPKDQPQSLRDTLEEQFAQA